MSVARVCALCVWRGFDRFCIVHVCQAASRAAMKQRILAQQAKEREEKEKEAICEEIKKKEQAMVRGRGLGMGVVVMEVTLVLRSFP